VHELQFIEYVIIAAEEISMARSAIACHRMILATPLLCCAIVSCRSTSAPIVAVVPETTAQEMSESVHAGAEHAAHSIGWSICWNGPSREDDVSRQIQIVNSAIARHVTGLILSPDHAVALISPVRSALAQGIPTVIVGSPLAIAPGGNLSFVLNDDAAMGRLAVQRLRPQLNNGDTVAILGINPDIISMMERARAFEQSMHDALPGVQVVEHHSTSFGSAEAEETAEETIRFTPKLRAIVTLNIVQTRAANFALMRSRAGGHILLVGCDQDLDLIRQVRAGTIDAIIAENSFVMGFDAVRIIANQRSGKPSVAARVVPPILVTRDNVDQPEVQQVLDMNWRMQ
jgi:ribose transport system substrate-binding protein